MISAVILAAGSSRRMGLSGKKELVYLKTKPVIQHSVDSFLKSGIFDFFVFVIREQDRLLFKDMLKDLPVPYKFIAGGETRQQSVLAGLTALEKTETDRVFIHDGARPYILPEDILKINDGLSAAGACVPVTPSVYAMKEIDESGIIRKHLKREFTVSAQTPQAFLFPQILEAHKKASLGGRVYIDDSEIWSDFQGDVKVVWGDPGNIKITYPRDLE